MDGDGALMNQGIHGVDCLLTFWVCPKVYLRFAVPKGTTSRLKTLPLRFWNIKTDQ